MVLSRVSQISAI